MFNPFKFFSFAEKKQVRVEDVPIEVFRAGDYGAKGVYTEADLDEIAKTFGQGNFDVRPKVKVDHDGKAIGGQPGPFGDVVKVERQGSSLFAWLANVPTAFKEWAAERPGLERSIELYPRKAFGALTLRALAFVTEQPEVKGMAALPAFSDEHGEYLALAFGDMAGGEQPGMRLLETATGMDGAGEGHFHLAQVDGQGTGMTSGPVEYEDGARWIDDKGHVHAVEFYVVQRAADGHAHALSVTTGDCRPCCYGEDGNEAVLFAGAPTKKEGKAGTFEVGAYAYAPVKQNPATWKIRLEETPGKVTAKQLGMACAAIGKGFRGQKADIPAEALDGVKKKIRAAYKSLGTKPADMPEVLKMGEGVDEVDGVDTVDNEEKKETRPMDKDVKTFTEAELEEARKTAAETAASTAAATFTETIKAQDAKIAELQRTNQRAQIKARLDAIAGLPPSTRNFPGLAEFCERLGGAEPIMFGEAGKETKQAPVDWLISFMEHTAKTGLVPLEASGAPVYEGPKGDDEGREKLRTAASEYQTKHPELSFSESLIAVARAGEKK
jgi:hypothetical protein